MTTSIHHFIHSRPPALHRVWVFSDLQQSDPASARRCMTIALNDFHTLNLPCQQLWYLGDAVEGANLAHVHEMTAMQIELLQPLNIPLRYVNGNHDFDLFQFRPDLPVITPFWNAIRQIPTWRTTARLEDFYYWETLGDLHILFLSDHCDSGASSPDHSPRWISTHGAFARHQENYPYDDSIYTQLRAEIAAKNGPVIIAGHGPFPGGNRAGVLPTRLLPLPPNVKLVLYGHAHIGDAGCVQENLFRKIAYIHHSNVPQIDVASLENRRGDAIRSVILEIYPDGAFGILFRDHSHNRWPEIFVLAADR